MTSSRRRVLLGLAAALAGCARRAATVAPSPLAPEDHLPSSLDLVLRVDLAKLRRALPDAAELSRRGAVGDEDAARSRLVDALATRGREAWIGARDRTFDDLVIAATGDLDELDLGPSFVLQQDADGERISTRADAPRGAPSWLLVRRGAIVVATPAMVDAVRRVRARAERSAHDVPREGVLGFSARARALVGDAAAARPPFTAMTLAQGSLEIEGGMLRGALRATFTQPEHAEHAARVVEALLERERARGHAELLERVEIGARSSARLAVTIKIPASALRRALGR